jgi:glyoxylase-like metal-dependent hydrolase (beta-lactamase superfamily II)/rhodanese-related sulfurtransferase
MLGVTTTISVPDICRPLILPAPIFNTPASGVDKIATETYVHLQVFENNEMNQFPGVQVSAMIFRQLFDSTSCTYSYLLASRKGGEALIIDPVLEQVDGYLGLLEELELELVKAVDTHVHADHATGLGALRDRTRCVTVMGDQSQADVVGMRVREGDPLRCDGMSLEVIHTPGHTDCSYSFLFGDRVFTGDTLMIGGTGRCDFQSGDAAAQYDSLFNKLLRLPDHTLVFPAHDYKGDTVSTIGEEREHNPRLQVSSVEEYEELMNGLNLPPPRLMDVVVPTNLSIGLPQRVLADRGCAVTRSQFLDAIGSSDVILVDVREDHERVRGGAVEGSIDVAYPSLKRSLQPGGSLHRLVPGSDARVIFVCTYGECSAMAVELARELGWPNCCHLTGGLNGWWAPSQSHSSVSGSSDSEPEGRSS